MISLDRAVGIDLGTTNSEVALLVPSEREILVYEDRFGRKTIPSAVAWDPAKKGLIVGRPARARRGKDPAPVESIKRRMGQDVRVSLGPEELSPDQVSAKILGELRAVMTSFLAEKASEGVEMRVDRAVITVPAYFDAPQVEATRRAGELAGLKVAGILQEPTAAAIYHAYKRKLAGGNFLVYDLGGGTFDVSILRCVGGEYQVLAIDGDNFLGGDDFDRRFAEHLRKQLVKRGYKLDLDVLGNAEDRARFEALVQVAQEIKESLSTAEVVSVSKQNITTDQSDEPVSIELEIGRAEYEGTIADLVERTIECAQRALAESTSNAGVDATGIDHVILVGGSTRVPLVRRRVQEALAAHSKGKEPLADEVDTIVALGAAIHAAQIGGLIVEEKDAGVSVHFTAPLATPTKKARIALTCSARGAEPRSVAVTSNDGILAENDLTGSPLGARLDVTPSGEGDVELSVEVRGDSGAVLGQIPFVLYRGEVRPRPSALSRASVIAKDVGLEVVRAGRRERRVLLGKGTGLPAEVKHTFYTADQSGTVVLRLLQGRMPIKTLAFTVPRDLPVGSTVDVTMRCDEAMKIEARAVVGGQELWATIEPPPQEKYEQDEVIERLLGEAEEARRSLWGRTGDSFRREVDRLSAAIREVLRTDPAKLSALCARLRQLLDDYAGEPGEVMQPPMTAFEEELDALRRIVYRSQGMLVGLDRSAWDDKIHDIETRANEAYSALDATAWRRTFNEVQALYETAYQEDFASRRLDDPAYIQGRINGASRWRMRVEQKIVDFAPSAAEELRAIQIAERDRLLDALRAKVTEPLANVESFEGKNPHDVRRVVDQCCAELERIESAMERLPALGLVTERGGSGGRA
ncbi:MAG: Hsp70 family protein [Polyangiaceae bacterium]